MNQYETSNLSIVEKAKSERLFMNYSLVLACLLTLIGTGLLVLGIGDHLDIVVKSAGTLEARFVNASPGFGMAVLGLVILAWAKPRRLQLSAHHNSTETDSEEFEESMRELMFEIERRTLKIDRQRYEKLSQELKQILGGVEPTTTLSSLDIKYSRGSAEDVEGEIPPFVPGQSDAERIRYVTDWYERKRKAKEEPSGGVDMLYQEGPKK